MFNAFFATALQVVFLLTNFLHKQDEMNHIKNCCFRCKRLCPPVVSAVQDRISSSSSFCVHARCVSWWTLQQSHTDQCSVSRVWFGACNVNRGVLACTFMMCKPRDCFQAALFHHFPAQLNIVPQEQVQVQSPVVSVCSLLRLSSDDHLCFLMPFRSLAQAAPSTGPTPPPILQTRSTTAAVTQGFPRIGVDLTASRPPPPRFPASGLETWEAETARKEDKGNAISTHPVWLDGLLKEEKKNQNRTNLKQCGRDNSSWDLQFRPGAVWVETGPLRIQPQLYPLT